MNKQKTYKQMESELLKEIIPYGEEIIFGICEQDEETPAPIEKTPEGQEEPKEKPKEEKKPKVQNPTDQLSDAMVKYIKSQLAEIKKGLLNITEEFDPTTVNSYIDGLKYADKNWTNLLILAAFGEE